MQRRVGGQRVEQQLVALCAVQTAHREHEVVVALGPVRQLLRRVRHHLRGDSRRALQAVGDVAGGCEHLLRLTQGHAIEPLDGPARSTLLRALTELPELGAVELVGLPELVQQPHHFVRMSDCIGGKLRRDGELDRASVGFTQIEQSPEKGLRKHALARIPLVGNGHEVRLVPASTKLADQIVGEDLGPAALERHLRCANGDPHLRPSRGTRASDRVPPLPPTDTLRRKPSRVRVTSGTSPRHYSCVAVLATRA